MSSVPPSSDPWGSGSPPGVPRPGSGLASWGQRVGATLVDSMIGVGILLGAVVVGAVVGQAAEAVGVLFAVVGYAANIGFSIWNLVRQGRTGQTVGKRALGIRLVRLDGVSPPGVGLSIGRAFLHVVDALPLYLGFLWPLWDRQRQTFTDKILNTVVVTA